MTTEREDIERLLDHATAQTGIKWVLVGEFLPRRPGRSTEDSYSMSGGWTSKRVEYMNPAELRVALVIEGQEVLLGYAQASPRRGLALNGHGDRPEVQAFVRAFKGAP